MRAKFDLLCGDVWALHRTAQPSLPNMLPLYKTISTSIAGTCAIASAVYVLKYMYDGTRPSGPLPQSQKSLK